MTQPQAYNRETDFTERDGDDTNHAGINTELDAAALSINELRDNLAQIQRDDGTLKNGIVTAESLSDSAFNAVLGEVATATAAASAAADRSVLYSTQSEVEKNAAQAAAQAAAASLEEFDDRYLGSKTANPTTDNDGNPLVTGALYFNSVAGEMRVWAGTFWKATGSAVGGTINTAKYTATAGQTSFAIVYDVGFVHVYLNGKKLESGVAFTANNGTNVILTTGATAGDVVDMIAFGIFSVADAYTKAQADALLGAKANQSTTYTKAELNASTGASLVGFIQSGTGAVARSVQDKLREIMMSLKDAGGVGSGTTSDQAAVVAALASGAESVLVNDNLRFLVASLSNPRGVEFDGHGHIVKAITGGLQKLNSYADKNQRVFGQEYLAYWHNILIAQVSAPTRKPIMVFSGDSTTAGVGLTDPLYSMSNLLLTAGESRGLQTPYGLSSINRGQSGAHTGQWVSTHLAGDLAASPDLLVLRWGINDPGWLKDENPAPLDAGQDYPNRRDVDDYLTSLRAGLTTIRASRNVASLSIVLMTPNSTFDTPNGRDAMWYEQIIPGIKQAARDFQCAFIDTYALARDTELLAGLSMDDPFGDGRGIHPTESFNALIAGAMADVIFPVGLQARLAANQLKNIGGAQWVYEASRTPDMFDYGITIGRADLTNGFLFDGAMWVLRSVDGIALQMSWAYAGDLKRFALRMGFGNSWGPWSVHGETAALIDGAGVFANAGMRVVLNESIAVIDGFLERPSGAPVVLAANSTFGVVPAGLRPVNDSVYCVATVWSGSAFEQRPCRIDASGNMQLLSATSIVVQRIYVSASWSTHVF